MGVAEVLATAAEIYVIDSYVVSGTYRFYVFYYKWSDIRAWSLLIGDTENDFEEISKLFSEHTMVSPTIEFDSKEIFEKTFYEEYPQLNYIHFDWENIPKSPMSAI